MLLKSLKRNKMNNKLRIIKVANINKKCYKQQGQWTVSDFKKYMYVPRPGHAVADFVAIAEWGKKYLVVNKS